MSYVFQYGSNTSRARLNSYERLKGDARPLCAAVTREDFDLVFDVWSTTNKCATADIVAGQGRQIWGVLYEIPEYLVTRETSGNRKSLDAIEGRKYKRIPIALIHPDGTSVYEIVTTYVVIDECKQSDIQTSLNYCRHIIAGLRDYGHFVPEEYVRYVKAQMLVNNPDLRDDLKSL